MAFTDSFDINKGRGTDLDEKFRKYALETGASVKGTSSDYTYFVESSSDEEVNIKVVELVELDGTTFNVGTLYKDGTATKERNLDLETVYDKVRGFEEFYSNSSL